MDRALYIAMTGAKHTMLSQTAHANNLANLETHGFKADFATARSMPVYFGEGLPSRAFNMAERPATQLAHGALEQTGRELDIAIEGDGWMTVQSAKGDEAYTRAGNLVIDELGNLRTAAGLAVIGNTGPIAVPPNSRTEIGIDGTVSIIPDGQSVAAPAIIDRIKLVNPPPDSLTKGEDGLFRQLDEAEPAPADGRVRVISGFLEASNVNAVAELTDLLSLARQYEMHVKLMATTQENSESSARLLQFNS